MKPLFYFLFSCFFLAWNPTPTTKSFAVSIGESCTVSAGVYNREGTLIRTLFSHRVYNAGTYHFVWDGLDDFGNPVTNPSGYTWKVLTNNLSYEWEGVIGNTSDSTTGRSIHKGLSQITDICFAGDYAYYGEGYNEQETRTAKFKSTRPQVRTLIDISGKKAFYEGRYDGDIPGNEPDITACATDGNCVYWAGNCFTATDHKPFTILYATDVHTDSIVTHSHDSLFHVLYGHHYPAFGIEGGNAAIRSMACQKKGNYLFCTRPDTNLLSIYNKNGALVRNITIKGISSLCIDATDNHLWLAHGLIVEQYLLNDNGILTSTGQKIACSDTVVGMDVNRSNTLLLIAEGGSQQQIKAYSPRTSAYLWTKGMKGGYANGASVSVNKFYWNDLRGNYKTFVKFAPDGSFWVNDEGNNRMLHFTNDTSYIEQIMYQPISYATGVDFGNVNRVWDNCLEFYVDYTKPILPNNRSWTLVNNWGYDLTSSQYNKYIGIKTPLTLRNGHTYCFVCSKAGSIELAELKKDGRKRLTGIVLPAYYYLDKSGDLCQLPRSVTSAIWYRRSLTGFDLNNNPLWSADSAVESYSLTFSDPVNWWNNSADRPNAVSSNGTRILFDRFNDTISKYHITGVRNGITVFRTGKSTDKHARGPKGEFPPADLFDIGNGVNYPAGSVNAVDSLFFLDYYGENWQQTETNMFNIYHQCGLAIGQFGVHYGSYLSQATRGMNAIAGDAGNSFAVQYVKLNDGTIRIYQNDEGIHSGLHRWKVSNLRSIHLVSGNF